MKQQQKQQQKCVCVECGARTNDALYVGNSSNIRLTRCRTCDALLDRYVEYDPVLVVVDLILHKSEVYRHLIFNRHEFSPWGASDSRSLRSMRSFRGLRSNIAVFFFLMVLFDAHTKWRIDVVTERQAVRKFGPWFGNSASVNDAASTTMANDHPKLSDYNSACPSAFSSVVPLQYSDVVLSRTGHLVYRNSLPPHQISANEVIPAIAGVGSGEGDLDREVVLASVTAEGGTAVDAYAVLGSVEGHEEEEVGRRRTHVSIPGDCDSTRFGSRSSSDGDDTRKSVTNVRVHTVAPEATNRAIAKSLRDFSEQQQQPQVALHMRQLPPALGGGCFNTSAEDAIIERWVDGIRDTKSWARGIRLLLLSLAENIVYITSIIISIRLWQVTCRMSRCVEHCQKGGGNISNKSSKNSSSGAFGGRDSNSISSGGSGSNSNSSGSIGDDTSSSSGTDSIRRSVSLHRDPLHNNSNLESPEIPLLSITMVVCAIIISSWGKAILIMLMIWEYANDMVHVVNLVVITSNVAAVQALLEHKGSPHVAVSAVLVLIPFAVLTAVRMLLAHAMGLTVVYSTEWTPW